MSFLFRIYKWGDETALLPPEWQTGGNDKCWTRKRLTISLFAVSVSISANSDYELTVGKALGPIGKSPGYRSDWKRVFGSYKEEEGKEKDTQCLA